MLNYLRNLAANSPADSSNQTMPLRSNIHLNQRVSSQPIATTRQCARATLSREVQPAKLLRDFPAHRLMGGNLPSVFYILYYIFCLTQPTVAPAQHRGVRPGQPFVLVEQVRTTCSVRTRSNIFSFEKNPSSLPGLQLIELSSRRTRPNDPARLNWSATTTNFCKNNFSCYWGVTCPVCCSLRTALWINAGQVGHNLSP